MKLQAQDSPSADMIIQGHGPITLLWPQNDAADSWLEKSVEIRNRWGRGVVVEHRYIGPIIEAFLDAGFTIHE